MKILFDKYISKELGLSKSDKIVLTISGGADSVAMLDLFSKSIYTCSIAHCNFHLRGNESDGDAELVENLANKYNLPFHKKDFETNAYAKAKGISIEMAARELRYNWFEEIRKSIDYQYIATAHHQDDMIETFFINLSRGTGIRGLSGIKAKNERIIRPMLFTNRKSIHEYLANEKHEYRNDSSNLDTSIIRNKLRHHMLPLLQEINPAANENIIKTIEHLQYSEYLMLIEIERCKAMLGVKDDNEFKINIDMLRTFQPISAYLYELLRPLGFTSTQLKDIENAFDSNSGKVFNSKTHQILKNRNELVISQLLENKPVFIEFTELDKKVLLPNHKTLTIKKLDASGNFKIPMEKNSAAIDFDKLKFPLLIRKWEQGDSFYPLGMKKKKKLSDFFIDEKLSRVEKQSELLLISDNQIVWIINRRIDDKFKITENTKNILLLGFISI